MKRVWLILCCLLLLGCFCWCFPLFHLVRIERAENSAHGTTFNATDFAKAFWSDRLTPSLAQVPDATAVISAFAASPEPAHAKFGRKIGVSRTTLVVVQCNGTIAMSDKKGVGVALQGNENEADIVLQTGLLFGNTVRDATGLLDSSNFPDSRQFNDVSTELNRIVETRIIPMLKEKAAVGRKIHFAGCAEIPDESAMPRPLKVIPLEIRIE
jgi:predicted lipoprotein